jgi:hypothetical protein
MKKLLSLLSSFGLLFICSGITAQTTNTPTPKVNTDSLQLVARISDNQLKLGKLQNTIDQKTKNKQDAADKSQQSADINRNAAEKLSDDPNDKTLARNADNKAGDAKSDARKARKESSRLDALNKSILDLQQKISVDQAKLRVYTNVPMAAPVMAPLPMQMDTTIRH